MKSKDAGVPPKLSEEKLRTHFRDVYRLDEDQVDQMIISSAKSLNTSLTALILAVDNGPVYEDVKRLGHSIKGLLLNMGEPEWAEFAREIEKAASLCADEDYAELVDTLRKGVETIF